MIDSRILGKRLKQVRLCLGITQKELAASTKLTQPAISRLENGEEVYASVLLAVLYFYHGKICLDNLFSNEFSADKEHILYRRDEDKRQNLLRQLEIITDIVKESNETCLSQIEMMKNTI